MDLFARCRGKELKAQETERVVCTNSTDFNQARNYANNYIKTSKYTALTFLPLNLFEQFQRIANTYFLILLILQVIPWISSLTWVTTVVPLALVLSITAIKDAYDDFQRHSSDNQVNNKKAEVLRDGKPVEEIWQNVVVGDIIKVKNDEFIAADLLLLASKEPNGLAYIETAELDGETNLKVRQALTETSKIIDYEAEQISREIYELTCEPPNNVLSKFEGTLKVDGNILALTNDQVLLRGCVLRNTQWCYGMVIFAGQDTKLMQNSGKAIFKRTHTDRLLNILIIGIVIFLLCLAFGCVIASGVWETLTGYYFQAYLPWESFIPGTSTGHTSGTKEAGATAISLLVFFSYLILFNTVVPISLYVSVEFLRLVQSLWINWDVKMYYEPKDTPAKARTTALNEELGQIEYIFSDKTGTLTQNVMTFNKCSIQGRSFGDPTDEDANPLDATSMAPTPCDFSSNEWYDKLVWYDRSLVKQIKAGDEGCDRFFTLLALCHTVMPEMKDGKLVYQAQSPDEEALVGAARDLGYVFMSRSPTTITINVHGVEKTFELLCILDFNNVRKRMSVIVKEGEKITLYCKGADTTVNARLDPHSNDLLQPTNAHLNEYANIGLRTLTLAYKELTLTEYDEWKEIHYQASISLTNRDDKLHDAYEKIEQNMKLIGATAIEDKLQDGVPDAIANLANAGIKIWVLTGDKQETAINIGYSCKLLTDEMEEVFVVDGETFETVKEQLTEARDKMLEIKRQHTRDVVENGGTIEVVNDSNRHSSSQPWDDTSIALVSFSEQHHVEEGISSENEAEFGGFGIVINGHSLIHGLSDKLEMLLLEVGCMCKAVICCRVTPLQKAKVVELVKDHKKSVTLAIGDGANDVSMIKTAHIGVGISGQEGMQAVLSSDFSFAQFRFLERLLLVHGRWSYLRMSKFLAYFFYKNFGFTLIHFWYAWFIGFSAQTVYDETFIAIYNVVYTSAPVVMLGVFDLDVDEDYSIKYPKLYTPGLTDMWFNKKRFALSLLEGLITSCVVFFFSYGCLADGVRHDGLSVASGGSFAFMTSSMLIIAVTLRIALETNYWTPFNHFFVWGSLAIFYIIHAVLYSDLLNYKFVGTMRFMCSTPVYWFGVALGVTVLIVGIVAIHLWRLMFNNTLSDRLRLRASIQRSKSNGKSVAVIPKTSIKREFRTQSIRSGYAFAHEEGFGEHITSGRYMRKDSQTVHNATDGRSKNTAAGSNSQIASPAGASVAT